MIFFAAVLLTILFSSIAFAAQSAGRSGTVSSARFYTLRLLPGTDVIDELRSFIREHKIQAGAVVSSVGSLSQVALRFANHSETTILKGDFEVICFSGTADSETEHLHLSVADTDGKMTGGHMLKGCITRTTMEIVLMELTDVAFRRERCPISGYDELAVSPRY